MPPKKTPRLPPGPKASAGFDSAAQPVSIGTGAPTAPPGAIGVVARSSLVGSTASLATQAACSTPSVPRSSETWSMFTPVAGVTRVQLADADAGRASAAATAAREVHFMAPSSPRRWPPPSVEVVSRRELDRAERAAARVHRNLAQAFGAGADVLVDRRLDAPAREQGVDRPDDEEEQHGRDDDERQQRVEEVAVEEAAAVDREVQRAEVRLA